MVAGADLAFLVLLRPESEKQNAESTSETTAQDRLYRWQAHQTPPASLRPVVASGSLPDAHHKTAVSHCVHPVKACPVHFAFFVHERPDNFPPAPAHQSLSVNVGVTVHSRRFHLYTA
ncbi:Uncharacterised protein [Shigella sonnei]|nr:Uncharacterised protein [Shigella sonnei]CST11674.1 Uncharacterised protein [Shigella sonnei]